jgi:hypothetical protein
MEYADKRLGNNNGTVDDFLRGQVVFEGWVNVFNALRAAAEVETGPIDGTGFSV